jgi:16S rRNA (adenine1518-N6/adenine1519-N6)-dimethyltransferase
VQKEVAERVAAAPGTSDYGALTVGVQAVAAVERLFTVPAGAFSPPPKVDSAVLRLTPLARPLVADGEIASFRRMVVGLFGFRRKQLLRGVRELTGWPAERAGAALSAAGIQPELRPEAVPPDGFVRLHHALVDAGWGKPVGL